MKTEELLQLRHLLGGMLTVLSFWALLSLNVQAGLLLFPAAVGCLVVLVRPQWLSRIPSRLWPYAGPALLLVVAVDFLISLPDLVPPLVRMMVWLLLYRNLAPRREREDMQLLLLCLFSVILSGALTVSLVFAFQILLFTPLAMGLLLLICVLDKGPDSAKMTASWEKFSWRHLMHHIRSVLDVRALLVGGLLFCFVVLVSTLLFILTPRFNLEQNIPFLQVRTQAMTGFSERVTLGDVSELVQDRSVAVRVDVPSLDAIKSEPYWRMLVLDQYEAGSFSMSRSLKRSVKRRTTRQSPGRLRASGQSGALWTFYMEGGVSRFLPLPGAFGQMRFQVPQELDRYPATQVHGIDSVTQSVFSYQLSNLRFDRRFPAESVEPLKQNKALTHSVASIDYPATTRLLPLPDSDRGALAQINRGIHGGDQLSAVDYSRRLTEYLWERFRYSLRPDGQVGEAAGSQDPVVNWLLEGNQGHCELFAGAFVLLAREAGYPVRLVIGFAGGSWNSVEDYFVLRQSDAHAWVEIFDSATEQWLRVDPTPGRGSSDPEMLVSGNLSYERGWDAWLDGLRIQWYRRIVNFEQDDQVALAQGVKDYVAGLTDALKTRWQTFWSGLIERMEGLFRNGLGLGYWPLVPAALLGYLFWRFRHFLVVGRLRSSPSKKRILWERRKAGRYLQRLQSMPRGRVDPDLIAALRAVRYGPEAQRTDVEMIFARAKRAHRALRRK